MMMEMTMGINIMLFTNKMALCWISFFFFSVYVLFLLNAVPFIRSSAESRCCWEKNPKISYAVSFFLE